MLAANFGQHVMWQEKNNSSKSKTGARAANIVMTTIRPLKIEVDEKTSSVWVDAGVKVWDLLRYLANYVTKEAPAGYTLPAPPWFVAQTIGGALATGTHGSNLKHGSLSNQVLAFQVVLANGTLTEISAESDPFLMRVCVRRLVIHGSNSLHIKCAFKICSSKM